MCHLLVLQGKRCWVDFYYFLKNNNVALLSVNYNRIDYLAIFAKRRIVMN